MKIETLKRALERARRLYATSGTSAGDDAADELEVGRCMSCNGHVLVAHPARGSLYVGPVEVTNDGRCPGCVAHADVWRVLDLALSPTAARLAAGTRADLFLSYGVRPESRRPLAGTVTPDPRRRSVIVED